MPKIFSTLRLRSPVLKKKIDTVRFHLQRLSLTHLLLAIIAIIPTILLVLSSVTLSQTNLTGSPTSQTATKYLTNSLPQFEDDSNRYVDPCLVATPLPLVHFDPSGRASSEFSQLLPSDVDPPAHNRIFAAFFEKYLFDPNSDIVVNLNSTARGRPTDILNGMNIAQAALRRFYADPSFQVRNYTLGYEHLDRVRGSRYVFHIFARNETHIDLRYVVTIQRTFDNKCYVALKSYPTEAFNIPVRIIVPYSARPKRFGWFLSQFEDLIGMGVHARLLVAVCMHNLTDVNFVQQSTRKSPARSHIQVITVPGDRTTFFSRAIAIREAAKAVPYDSVMFISDIDMYIFPKLFDSCRYNAVEGSQVYFPVFYSLFPRNDHISKSAGYWRDSSLGMSCMYRSDFDAVAAYDDAEKFIGWGKEDRALSEAFHKHPRYEVFRAIEPALRHKWHRKHCEPLTSAYEDCLAVMFQQLGDMKSVGRFMLKNKLDVQKFFEKFADDDDDTLTDIGVKSSLNETARSKELGRIKNRIKVLQMNLEMKKKRDFEREKRREIEWRRRTGITKEQDEEAFREKPPADQHLESLVDANEDKEAAKDRELVRKLQLQQQERSALVKSLNNVSNVKR